MMEPHATKSSWCQHLAGEFLADRRKAAALVLLLAVLGVVAGRVIVRQTGPDHVRADETATVDAGQSRQSRKSGSATDVPPTHPTRQANPTRRRATAKITRDIFRIDQALLPTDRSDGSPDPAANGGTDRTEGIQERKRRIGAEAAELVLQSTIVGTSPTAIVNDHVLRVGEMLGGFRVIEVTARNCVVEKDEIKVRLYMGGSKGPSETREDEGKSSSPPQEKSSAK